MRPDYVVIGHVTHDLQPDGSVVPGGTALYAAVTAARLGQRVGVLTAGSHRAHLIPPMPAIESRCQTSPVTTTFVNRYHAGERSQVLSQVAPPIDLGQMPCTWATARIVHLAPVAQEIPLAAVTRLAPAWLCATPQGWLRSWGPAGSVTLGPPPRMLLDVPIRALVVSEGAEADLTADLAAAIVARGGVVAITRAASGSTVHWAEGRQDIASYKVTEVDPTGAGDVYAAALFIRLAAGDPPPTAAAYASAAAALSVTGIGSTAIPDQAAIQRCMGAA